MYSLSSPAGRYNTGRLLAATVAMTAAVLLLGQDIESWLNWSWQRRAMEIALVCCAGIAAYLAAHLLSGTRMRHLRAPGAV